MIMGFLLPIILLLVGYALLLILYLNRGSSRIQEASVIIATVIIGALVFVTKEESLEGFINTVYFIDLENKQFCLFNKPILRHYYLNQSVILGSYENRLRKAQKDVSFDFPKDHKAIIDIHTMAVLEHMGLYYGRSWHVEGRSTEVPSGRVGSYRQLEIENVNKDTSIFTTDSLPNNMKQNMFFEDLKTFQNLALPKGTRMYYVTNPDNPFVECRFYKPFSFDVRIKVCSLLYTIGLGDVGDYLGITDFERSDTRADDPSVKKYGTFVITTHYTAKFSKIKAWNPAVIRYKKWAKNLFDDLYNAFDWKICFGKLKDREETLAHRKIIHKL